jgi:hypothetical protein
MHRLTFFFKKKRYLLAKIEYWKYKAKKKDNNSPSPPPSPSPPSSQAGNSQNNPIIL